MSGVGQRLRRGGRRERAREHETLGVGRTITGMQTENLVEHLEQIIRERDNTFIIGQGHGGLSMWVDFSLTRGHPLDKRLVRRALAWVLTHIRRLLLLLVQDQLVAAEGELVAGAEIAVADGHAVHERAVARNEVKVISW